MAARIERLPPSLSEDDLRELAQLLLDAVDSGASVSFMPGLTEAEAMDFWRRAATAHLRSVILAAKDDQHIVGSVQLQPAWAPNQPHRADVAKLIVHRRARNRGLARLLMEALERQAVAEGFTLLLLDTCEGSAAERLYASLGWTRVGVVPGFAVNPNGSTCDTVFFYKQVKGST